MILLAPGGAAGSAVAPLPQHARRIAGGDAGGASAHAGAHAGALPPGAPAVLELAPREAFWKKDYHILAHMLGLRFQRLYGNLSTCLPQPPLRVRWQQRLAEFNKWLTCNVSVDAEQVARTARAMDEGCASRCFEE